MKKISLLVVALAVLAFAPAAKADPFLLTNGGPSAGPIQYAGTGSLAGATAETTWVLIGNQLTVTISNTSSMANVAVTGLAFNTTPNVGWTIGAQTGAISGWTSPGGAGGDGIMEVRAGNAGACGQTGAICTGQSGSITFNLTGLDGGNLTIDASSLHIQTNLGSIKPTGTTVPEPATLFLMGTGLLGAGRIVRKRLQQK